MLESLLLLISVFYGYDLNGMLNNRGLIFIRNYFMIRIRLVENLMVTAYDPKLKDTPFYETHFIEETQAPAPVNQFRADLETVDRSKNSSQYWSSGQWY